MTPALPADDLPVTAAPPAAPETAGAVAAPALRDDKELMVATRAFTEEDRAKGWWATLSSLAILAALTAGAMFSPWWPLR